MQSMNCGKSCTENGFLSERDLVSLHVSVARNLSALQAHEQFQQVYHMSFVHCHVRVPELHGQPGCDIPGTKGTEGLRGGLDWRPAQGVSPTQLKASITLNPAPKTVPLWWGTGESWSIQINIFTQLQNLLRSLQAVAQHQAPYHSQGNNLCQPPPAV